MGSIQATAALPLYRHTPGQTRPRCARAAQRQCRWPAGERAGCTGCLVNGRVELCLAERRAWPHGILCLSPAPRRRGSRGNSRRRRVCRGLPRLPCPGMPVLDVGAETRSEATTQAVAAPTCNMHTMRRRPQAPAASSTSQGLNVLLLDACRPDRASSVSRAPASYRGPSASARRQVRVTARRSTWGAARPSLLPKASSTRKSSRARCVSRAAGTGHHRRSSSPPCCSVFQGPPEHLRRSPWA